ncbi:MAG TPA: DinB family protein [Blastocatellia bacterium]|nr:DinB family protein [Blastocatellia bacterium]
MDLKELLLMQLEREAAAARKVVERVPEGKNDWKPHEKSMPLGYLATLVATMPGWVSFMIDRDELNLDDPSGEAFKTKVADTRAELLDRLETSLSRSRQALQATTEEHLMKPWRFKMGGRVVSEDLRYIMLLNAVFSHLAHHRGQLTVYLRLNEASVPAIFGPSADEQV